MGFLVEILLSRHVSESLKCKAFFVRPFKVPSLEAFALYMKSSGQRKKLFNCSDRSLIQVEFTLLPERDLNYGWQPGQLTSQMTAYF